MTPSTAFMDAVAMTTGPCSTADDDGGAGAGDDDEGDAAEAWWSGDEARGDDLCCGLAVLSPTLWPAAAFLADELARHLIQHSSSSDLERAGIASKPASSEGTMGERS